MRGLCACGGLNGVDRGKLIELADKQSQNPSFAQLKHFPMAGSVAERMFGRVQGLGTSWLYRTPNEEKVHFAYQDSTELANLESNTTTSIVNTNASSVENGQPPAINGGIPPGSGPPGDESGVADTSITPIPPNYGEGSNDGINRKPISSWDAAWNVTNAIQVIIDLIPFPPNILSRIFVNLFASSF